MSADGLEVYVSSERSGGLGYIDMWRSTRENADNPWGPLVNVQEINSRYNESFPCLSADGLTLYFSDWYVGWNAADDRPGGLGRRDLWMCTRASRNDPWGTPVNMGAPFNSGSTDGLRRSIWGRRSIARPMTAMDVSQLMDWPCSSVPTVPAAGARMTYG